jgi:toxin secretion/phage lysis holin
MKLLASVVPASIFGLAFPEFTGQILLFVLISIALDFLTGVRAAHKLGKTITSDGLNKTINKCLSYFSLITISIILQSITKEVLKQDFNSLTTIVMCFILTREMLSILENVIVLCVKPPKIIKQILNLFTEATEGDEIAPQKPSKK